MPSLFSLADQQDLPRSMTKCPPEIRVNEWNGRIGNHYFQVSQAVVAALLCHITHVKFPPHIYMQVGGRNYQQQDGLLDMPEDLTLPAGLRRHEDLNIPISCPMYNNHTWYQHHCRMVPAWHHRQVMKAFLRPYLGKTLANLVQAPRDVGTDRVLTIHLRADDVHRWNKGEYEWGQPPCSMYQKIIAEFGYRSMQIVAKTNPVTRRSDAACDGWLVDYGRDLSAMIRAQNLVLAFSSLSLSAALLSNELQVMYRRRDAQWYSILHSIINCNVWTGVTMYEYNTSLQQDNQTGSASEWLKTFPPEQITGPFTCQHGSEIKPEI
ncbi:deoC [Symbiodinium natans]|uniref:DeoC protein n=1 Tax=Symbiodinium natans TaxID=878477 RepID=A0A812TCC4_9DINO|nr:deoC [Symbiodinium natans]